MPVYNVKYIRKLTYSKSVSADNPKAAIKRLLKDRCLEKDEFQLVRIARAPIQDRNQWSARWHKARMNCGSVHKLAKKLKIAYASRIYDMERFGSVPRDPVRRMKLIALGR